jgi:VanZ family protein
MVLAVLWTAFIIYGLTSIPSELPRFPWLALPWVDKVIHVVLFGVEAALLGLASTTDNGPKRWLSIFIWCFVLGGGLEIIQYYWVDGRSGDVFDLLADMLGSLAGMASVHFIF